MKINQVKIKFDDTTSIKYLPFEYCCGKAEEHLSLYKEEEWYEIYEYYDSSLKMGIKYEETRTSWGDEWTDVIFIPFDYCQFCGEKIEYKVIKEVDKTEEYNELTQQRKEKW